MIYTDNYITKKIYNIYIISHRFLNSEISKEYEGLRGNDK